MVASGFRSPKRLAAVFILALALIGVSVDSAAGQAVQCGQVITQDVRLDSDLECPADTTGLVIGADDVTVNLNRHTISGFASLFQRAGVNNQGGYDRVTVRNGTIRGFNSGIVATDANDNRFLRLSVAGNTAPAIGIFAGEGNTVRDSELISTLVPLAAGGDGLRIVGNTVNSTGPSVAIGITSTSSVIARNTTGTVGTGGIAVSGASNHIVHNHVVRGLTDPSGPVPGIGVRGEGVRGFGSNNLVAHNRVSASGDGIFVFSSAIDTSVRHNWASGNADDGIEVQSPSTTVTGNTANDNGDLGIEAVPGVIDGGGNRASGNGNLWTQCLNITCSP
jgi:parallel beta-helix repeat protein